MKKKRLPIMTCFDVADKSPWQEYGVLTDEEYQAWVSTELQLNVAYQKDGCGVSALLAGDPKLALITSDPRLNRLSGIQLKNHLLDRIETFFLRHTTLSTCRQFEETWRAQFIERLENPALLRNFLFFDIPSSEAMLQFYVNVWNGNVPAVMDLLHDSEPDFAYRGFDGELKSRFDPTDSWPVMSTFEAMNISERQKSEWLCGKLHAFARVFHTPPRVVSLGAGNITERNVFLPETIYTAFDTSPFVLSPEEIFPGFRMSDRFNRQNLNYFKEDVFGVADHPELFGTQDFVFIMGLSMYLDDDQLNKLFILANRLLRPGGQLLINYLLLTDSVRRIAVQGWPHAELMHVATHASQAYDRAIGNAAIANTFVGSSNPFQAPHWQVTTVKPWGAQNCLFSFRKEKKS